MMMRKIVFALGMTTCLGNSDLADARLNPFIFEDVPHLNLKSSRAVKGISRNERYFFHSSRKPNIVRERKPVLFTRRLQPSAVVQRTSSAQRIPLKQEIQTRRRVALQSVIHRREIKRAPNTQPALRYIRSPLNEIQKRKSAPQPSTIQSRRLPNPQPVFKHVRNPLNTDVCRIQPRSIQIRRNDILANKREFPVHKPPQVTYRGTSPAVLQPVSFREFLRRGILDRKRIDLSPKQSMKVTGHSIRLGQSLSLKEMMTIAKKPLLSTVQKSTPTHQPVLTQEFRNAPSVTTGLHLPIFSVKKREAQEKPKENPVSQNQTGVRDLLALPNKEVTATHTPLRPVSASEKHSASFISFLLQVQEPPKSLVKPQDISPERQLTILSSERLAMGVIVEPSQSLQDKTQPSQSPSTEILQRPASQMATSQTEGKVPPMPKSEEPKESSASTPPQSQSAFLSALTSQILGVEQQNNGQRDPEPQHQPQAIIIPAASSPSSQDAHVTSAGVESEDSSDANPFSSLDPFVFAHVSTLEGHVNQAHKGQQEPAQTSVFHQHPAGQANSSLLQPLQQRRKASFTPLSLSRSLSQPQALKQRARSTSFSGPLPTEERRNDPISPLFLSLPVVPIVPAPVEKASAFPQPEQPIAQPQDRVPFKAVIAPAPALLSLLSPSPALSAATAVARAGIAALSPAVARDNEPREEAQPPAIQLDSLAESPHETAIAPTPAGVPLMGAEQSPVLLAAAAGAEIPALELAVARDKEPDAEAQPLLQSPSMPVRSATPLPSGAELLHLLMLSRGNDRPQEASALAPSSPILGSRSPAAQSEPNSPKPQILHLALRLRGAGGAAPMPDGSVAAGVLSLVPVAAGESELNTPAPLTPAHALHRFSSVPPRRSPLLSLVLRGRSAVNAVSTTAVAIPSAAAAPVPVPVPSPQDMQTPAPAAMGIAPMGTPSKDSDPALDTSDNAIAQNGPALAAVAAAALDMSYILLDTSFVHVNSASQENSNGSSSATADAISTEDITEEEVGGNPNAEPVSALSAAMASSDIAGSLPSSAPQSEGGPVLEGAQRLHLVLRLRGANEAVSAAPIVNLSAAPAPVPSSGDMETHAPAAKSAAPAGNPSELSTNSDPTEDTADDTTDGTLTDSAPSVGAAAAAAADVLKDTYVLLGAPKAASNNHPSAAPSPDSTGPAKEVVSGEVKGQSSQQALSSSSEGSAAAAPSIAAAAASAAPPAAAQHQQPQPQPQASQEDEDDFEIVEPGAAVAPDPGFLQRIVNSINPANWLAAKK